MIIIITTHSEAHIKKLGSVDVINLSTSGVTTIEQTRAKPGDHAMQRPHSHIQVIKKLEPKAGLINVLVLGH